MSDLKKAAQPEQTAMPADIAKVLFDNVESLYVEDAQPEQEPVLHKWAALFEDPNNDWQAGYESARRWVLEVGLQSIATPPQRKPLSGDEMLEVLKTFYFDGTVTFGTIVRAIEKAHGIGSDV